MLRLLVFLHAGVLCPVVLNVHTVSMDIAWFGQFLVSKLTFTFQIPGPGKRGEKAKFAVNRKVFGLGHQRAASGEKREKSKVLMQIRTCACKGRTRPEWQQRMTD